MKFLAWLGGAALVLLLLGVMLWQSIQFGLYYLLFGGWRHK